MKDTKQLIKTEFWKLLAVKPFNKITVRDIVIVCQINRNTFYYHFENVQMLAKETVEDILNPITESIINVDDPFDRLKPFVEVCLQNKKQILNIYHSSQREVFIYYLNAVFEDMINKYLCESDMEINPESEFMKTFCRLFRCTAVGITQDWLENNMNYDMMEVIRLYRYIYASGKIITLPEMLKLMSKE